MWCRSFAAVVALSVALPAAVRPQPPAPAADLVTAKVERGDVARTVTERGSLEAVEKTDIICRARAAKPDQPATVIKWVIDDGTRVKKGDLLIELDDSALQERIKEQEIRIAQRDRELNGRTNGKHVDPLPRAVWDAQQRVEGAEADKQSGKERDDLQRRKLELTLQQTKRALELVKLRSAGKSPDEARLTRELAEGEVELADLELKAFLVDAPARERQREDRLRQARHELDEARVRSFVASTEQDVRDKANAVALDQERRRLEELKDELAHCRITAPGDGFVVYYVPEQTRFGGPAALVAQGEPVREGQKLLSVVDTSRMQVATRFSESVVSLLRGDAPGQPGQPAAVRVDAYPDRRYTGHVQSISTVAARADALRSDVKVYPAVVALDGPAEGLKPGMSATVTVKVAERTNVLRVPVQAVVRDGPRSVCYALAPGGPEKREVTVGLVSEKFVEVRAGLQEGESVVMNPGVLRRP
jgi:RND family efflux transporter MFP subunit